MSKKTSSWRRLGVTAVTGLALVSLVACSGGGSGGSDSGSATEGNLVWWGWTPDKPVADQLIAAFNEEYPDITVYVERLRAEIN